MCIKFNFSQCKEAEWWLWGALKTSLHSLQWDTHLPKLRLQIPHSTPSPVFSAFFCVCMEQTRSKTSFVINIYSSYITSCLPAFADSSPGSRSILMPTLPLFYPLERLNRHYISSLQQKAFLLLSTFVILPSLRLLPLRSLKIFLRSPG